uniref:Uncharacterized protein n=1 Tax=Oryza punctata TaxID=4537 RepID=A0A0E0MLD4_ORYPU
MVKEIYSKNSILSPSHLQQSAPCAKFAEAFPLPTSKGPGETESRPDGFYQLRDEADFPPLQTGSC